MDLRKMRASAEHEARQAAAAAEAVDRVRDKVARTEAAVDLARVSLTEAEAEAEAAASRAAEAEAVYRQAADGVDATASAEVATATGKAV